MTALDLRVVYAMARATAKASPLHLIPSLGGQEDLVQELVLHYFERQDAYDETRSSPEAYANMLMHTKRRRLAEYHGRQVRHPRDRAGRVSRRAFTRHDTETDDREYPDPDRADVYDLRRALDDSGQAWADLVSSLAEGDTYFSTQIRIAAAMRALRGKKHVPDSAPATDLKVPDCHAHGAFPEGYDVTDVLCQNCTLKYECLPEARKLKLIATPIDADTEVAAHLRGLVTIEQMVERQYTRARLMEGNHEVPPSMAHNAPDVLQTPMVPVPRRPAPGPAPLPAGTEVMVKIRKAKRPPRNAPQCVDSANLTVDTKEGVFFYGLQIASLGRSSDGWGWFSADGANESDGWYAKKAACLADLRAADCTTTIIKTAASLDFPFSTKPSKKPAPVPKEEPKPVHDTTSGEGAREQGWPQTSGGRACPIPKPFKHAAQRENTLDKLHKSLGTEIRLRVGHRLVRRQRNGKECVVEILAKGFAYDVGEQTAKACGFSTPRQIFRSLSAVAQWHTRRQTSGNAYFHLQLTQTCIEDAKGNILDGRGAV